MTRALINNPFYLRHSKIYWVNAGPRRELRTDILKPLIDSLESMLVYHCRVHIARFDLHLPALTPNNQIISRLQRSLFSRIRSNYKTKNVGFVWVREKESADAQHYHCVIYLDGNKIRHPGKIQKWIKEIWLHLDGNSCHWSGYHNVRRGGEDAIQRAVHHFSYLAKTRGKGKRARQTKDYGWARNICASGRANKLREATD